MAEAIVKDGKVAIVDRDGAAFTVSQAELPQALTSGYRLETAEGWDAREMKRERSTLGQQALTAGEGALETATLGLGTAAAVELGGEEYRRAAQERAEANPVARGIGQVAGAVAPAFIPGGQFTPAGLVARGGAAVERGVAGGLARAGLTGESLLGQVAGRAIALGAQGAAEGAAYGLGSSLAESALDGTDWTAERAMHGLGTGALYGLAGGAAVGAGEAIAARAGRKLLDAMASEGKTLRQAARDFADKRLLGSVVTEDAKTVSRLTRGGENPERLGELAEKLRARGATSETIGRAIGEEVVESRRVQAGIAQSLDDAGIRPSGSSIFADLDEQAEKLAASGLRSDERLAGRLKRELEPLRRRLELPGGEFTDPTFTEAANLHRRLEKLGGGWSEQKKPAMAEAAQALADSVGKRLDEAAAAGGEAVGAAWSAARADARDFGLLRAAVRREPAKATGAGLTGMGGTIASLVMGHTTPAAIVSGLLTGAGHKLIAERGTRALGWIAERVAGLERVSNDTARQLAGLDAAPARIVATFADRSEDFDAVRKDVQLALSDPGHLATRIQEATGPALAEQSEVAMGMATRIVDDYRYLATLVPPPITRGAATIQPQRDEPKIPRKAKEALVSAATALRYPKSAFSELASGNVNWAAIDALKARRPGVWQDFRMRVAVACAEQPDAIPYPRRVMLGTVFEFPSDPSMIPGAVPPIDPTPQSPANQIHSAPGSDTGGSLATPAEKATQGAAA